MSRYGDASRVLVVALREPWPLNHGGRLRLHHFLRQLASCAEVTLALPGPAEHAEHMPDGVRLVDMAAGAMSLSSEPEVRFRSRSSGALRRARAHFGCRPEIDSWLAANANRYDVLLLSGATTGLYVESSPIPVVWDCVDDLVLHTLRAAACKPAWCWPTALRRALLYARYQGAVRDRAATTIVSSSVDERWSAAWGGDAKLTVISNGVDGDEFQLAREAPDSRMVVFVGSLEFPPNVDGVCWFVDRIWPELLKRDPARRLRVVGRRPVERVRALADRPGVELLADVPDVRPHLACGSVVIAPTRQGGGVKNKILEACAVGRAVVASPQAAGGLDVIDGRELRVARRPRDWVRIVDRLLCDADERSRLATAGAEWVRRAHRWPVLGRRLFDLLRAAAFSGGAAEAGAAPGRVDPAGRKKRVMEATPWR